MPAPRAPAGASAIQAARTPTHIEHDFAFVPYIRSPSRCQAYLPNANVIASWGHTSTQSPHTMQFPSAMDREPVAAYFGMSTPIWQLAAQSWQSVHFSLCKRIFSSPNLLQMLIVPPSGHRYLQKK